MPIGRIVGCTVNVESAPLDGGDIQYTITGEGAQRFYEYCDRNGFKPQRNGDAVTILRSSVNNAFEMTPNMRAVRDQLSSTAPLASGRNPF